jgi:DNA-binding MarR family transcriptional regulator
MYRLTTSVPFLLNRLGVRLGELFSRRIEPYGLTLHMYRVLAALSERPDQKLGHLSSMTTIDLSTMSRLIGSMARAGWVSRIRVPSDERTVRINLTEKGAELAATLMREAQHYEDVATRSLSGAAIRRLKADCIRVYDALDVLEEELIESAPLTAAGPASPRTSGAQRLARGGGKPAGRRSAA